MAPVIMVATPCYGGAVTQAYMLSFLKLQRLAAQAGFGVKLSLLGYDSLVSRARSILVSRFMDDPDSSHLLFIDADIGFEPDQVQRMLELNKDFTGALYPIKAIDWARIPERCVEHGESLTQAALNYVGTFLPAGERRDEAGFATASYAGGGFQLISRAAIGRMFDAFPELRYRKLHIFPQPPQESPHLYALFDCIIDQEAGVYLSEDYSFCRRWREIGGDIWLDTTSRLTHVGTMDFVGDHPSRLYSLE